MSLFGPLHLALPETCKNFGLCNYIHQKILLLLKLIGVSFLALANSVFSNPVTMFPFFHRCLVINIMRVFWVCFWR